jgi:hypothetical protein
MASTTVSERPSNSRSKKRPPPIRPTRRQRSATRRSSLRPFDRAAETTSFTPREVIAYCLSGMSELAFAEAEHERAAKLLGAAEELFHALGETRTAELRESGARSRPEELVS